MDSRNHTLISTAAADAFALKLQSVDTDQLPLSDYDRRYLTHLLQHARYYSRIYAFLLNRVVALSGRPPAQMVLMDYGAGNGLMGIMAKASGIGRVYLVDNNPVFLDAARSLAGAMGISVDGYVCGDITADPGAFHSLHLDAVVGFDVIEHVYSLPEFFRQLASLNNEVTVVMGTGANTHHPIKAARFRNLQRRDELVGGNPDDFTLYGAAPERAFRSQRLDIITAAFPDLDRKTADELANRTRGLRKEDILQVVHQYSTHGVLPDAPAHPTNTCDPQSGSWTEHLVPAEEYASMMRAAGFTFRLDTGFYNAVGSGWRPLVLRAVNLLIPFFGKGLAPFLVFSGKRIGEKVG